MRNNNDKLKQLGLTLLAGALMAVNVSAMAGNKVKSLSFKEASSQPTAIIKIKNNGSKFTGAANSKATFRVNVSAKCKTSYVLKTAAVSPTKFSISNKSGIAEVSPAQYTKHIDPRGNPREINWKNIGVDIPVSKLYSNSSLANLCNKQMNSASGGKAKYLKSNHSYTKMRSMYLAVYCKHKKKNKGSHRQAGRPMPVRFICLKK